MVPDFGHENNNLADNNNAKSLGGRVVFALGDLRLPWPGMPRFDGLGKVRRRFFCSPMPLTMKSVTSLGTNGCTRTGYQLQRRPMSL